jgi:hypothetical protein
MGIITWNDYVENETYILNGTFDFGDFSDECPELFVLIIDSDHLVLHEVHCLVLLLVVVELLLLLSWLHAKIDYWSV